MTNTAESTDLQPLEYLGSAPPFIFLLIAAADGKVEEKELKRFVEVLGKEEFAVLAAVMAKCGLPMDKLLAVAQERLKDPMTELVMLAKVIDATLPGEVAGQFKAALVKLGHAVGQVSAGLFSRLRGKLGKEESAMLALITATLMAGGAPGEAEAPAAESAPEDVLTDQLFPALKPTEWGEQARGQVAMQSVQLDQEFGDDNPVVGYVQDMPETVRFVTADEATGDVTVEAVHARAMENLDRRLGDAVEWHTLSFDADVEGLGTVDGLVLTGDYFAAEGILSETRLKQAHEKLDSALLMAMAPQRGELFVTKLVSEEEPERERVIFAQFAIKRFFNPEQAPISPNVFIVRNGKIVGNVRGMDEIIAAARKMAEEEQAHEDSLLQHTASLVGGDDRVHVRVEVEAACIETLNKNLQHVIRAYAQKMLQDDRFSGAIEVDVKVNDETYADRLGEVAGDLTRLQEFLTNQFAALNFKTSTGESIVVKISVADVEPA